MLHPEIADVLEGRAQWAVLCSDALDVLPTLPGGCVDAVVTDPPYLLTDLDFDRAGLDMGWIKACLPVVQDHGYLASTGGIELLARIGQAWHMRFTGVWLKPRGTMRTATAKKPMTQSEPYAVYAHPGHDIARLVWNPIAVNGAGTSYRKEQKRRADGYRRGGRDQLARADTSGWTQNGYVSESDGMRWQTSVIEAPFKATMPFDERTEHPTQKPIKLMRVLIEWLTNPAAVILDPFAGSGTTGVAALLLGRRAILIERDPAYADIARRRCEEAAAQPRLFPVEAPPKPVQGALQLEVAL